MITKDMSITDVVDKYPETAEVFQEFGMHCFG
jgi:hydrid cluster protein-associated redox disulfide domain